MQRLGYPPFQEKKPEHKNISSICIQFKENYQCLAHGNGIAIKRRAMYKISKANATNTRQGSPNL
jgi:hypothetical protein